MVVRLKESNGRGVGGRGGVGERGTGIERGGGGKGYRLRCVSPVSTVR